MLRPLQMLSERRHASRVSRHLLHWHSKVHAEHPDLSGPPLYLKILMLRGELDELAASDVLHRAMHTFDWNSDRTLRFRDVVLVVASDEYLQDHPRCKGIQENLGRIVARHIPDSL